MILAIGFLSIARLFVVVQSNALNYENEDLKGNIKLVEEDNQYKQMRINEKLTLSNLSEFAKANNLEYNTESILLVEKNN